MDSLERLVAFTIFIFFLPIIILIGIIIMIDSPGPILFSQTRLGKNLRKFKFYKFRTMWQDAEEKYPHLYRYKYSKNEIKNFRFKIENDPRLTRFGKYLRKTSLDELPNLINVIKGDMSLIGPRPEIPEMLPYYKKEDLIKFSVKSGITGYAQISGRGLLTLYETIQYDTKYVNEKNLFTDIKVIIKTIFVVIKGLGAF